MRQGHATIEVRGEQLLLLPERAVYWPAAGMLLIADMHCGKAAVFRANHIAIPEGNMEADLLRLTGLLERTGASSLAILGDWIHAAASSWWLHQSRTVREASSLVSVP